MTPTDLVYIDEFGLLGSNFYWHKYANHGLTKEDVLSTGLTDDRGQVSAQIIEKLVEIDRELQKHGFYREQLDEQSRRYQELQDYLAGLMLDQGFRVGTRREYFHFDFRPDTPRNYSL